MMSALLVALGFISAHGGWSAAALNSLVVPGHSVGGVSLGGSLSDFQRAFPMPPDFNGGNLGDTCGNVVAQWVDLSRGETGVYAYFKNGQIFQLSVHTGRFALSSGIKLGATEERVGRHYPGGRKFILSGSGAENIGGRDLQYWVLTDQGLAFELYWNSRDRHREVSAIDIFVAGREFLPEACVSEPQKWLMATRP